MGFILPYTLITSAKAEIVCGPNEKPIVYATTDVLFLIDTSPSMCPYTAAVSKGMKKFVTKLEASGADARYAVASFGGAPRVLQAFTVCHIYL